MSGRRSEPLRDCRILVVEDEYYLASDLEKVLRENGAKVIGPVGDLSEAMSLIDHHRFDVAIIDINLHDELAYPLADELGRRGIPYVFATGYSAGAIPDRYRSITRWEKPFELAKIVDGLVPLCGCASKTFVPTDPR